MVARKRPPKNPFDEYPDDIFKESRMSFGDHLEELRTRMWRAIKWLLVFLVLGFILDAIGKSVGNSKIGIGVPMLKVITDPVETQVRDFYYRRAERIAAEKLAKLIDSTPEEIQDIERKLKENNNDLTSLTAGDREWLMGAPSEMPVAIPVKALESVFGPSKPGSPEEIAFKMKVYPAYISYLSDKGQTLLESK